MFIRTQQMFGVPNIEVVFTKRSIDSQSQLSVTNLFTSISYMTFFLYIFFIGLFVNVFLNFRLVSERSEGDVPIVAYARSVELEYGMVMMVQCVGRGAVRRVRPSIESVR